MKEYDPVVTRALLRFAKPYWQPLLLSLLLMLLGSAAAVAYPYLIQIALDRGLAAGSITVLRNVVIAYVLIAILQWASIYIRVNIMARVGQSIIFDLRSQLFEHLQQLSLGFFSRYSVGRIIVRVINDVGVLREFITWALLAIARDIFTLFGILIAMLSMNLRLSLLTFTVLPVMIVVTYYFRKKARANYRLVRTAISWVNSVLAENINAVRVVQAFARQSHNHTFYRDTVNKNNLDTNLKAARLSSLFYPAIDFLGTLAMAVVVWFGSNAVLGQTLTPGVLIAFILYINRFFEPIRDLSMRFDSFQSTMASGERILALLSAPVEVQDTPNCLDLPPIRGEVQFDNVSFHYADDPATPVLRNVSLHIHPGETVALVGKTGAGKTTVIKLLARFHDPTEGKVLIDGYDLKTIAQNSLRQQMGIVLQDPFLFSGTVRDNIRFGRLEATQQEIEAVAQAVGAHEFITRLKEGYDTPVEEGGVVLSVGQRQLISFARALLADPRILILDEATSSVDTQTEQLIQQALARLLKGRTSFVIAHRLSTIINANHIIVMQDGRIIEQGTHTELLAQRGEYFRLYSMRFEEIEEK